MKVKSESEVAQVVYLKVTQSCLTPSDPMDCSLPGSSVHGILQARVLEWGAIAFSGLCNVKGANCNDEIDLEEELEENVLDWLSGYAFHLSSVFGDRRMVISLFL